MQTISELNAKWWYRLVKVVYFFTIIISIGISFIGAYVVSQPEFDEQNSYILCDNGKKVDSKEYNISEYSDTVYSNGQDIKFVCSRLESGLSAQEIEIVNRGMETGKSKEEVLRALNNYRSEQIKQLPSGANYKVVREYMPPQWFQMILISVASVLGILLTSEIIRRIFYYIILGKIKPEK